ncbi:MAG: sugar ABC transporter permease [Actinomycetota bacterium]|nr:sugar ABC transporter permease [Actinomycetota bacterium]
MTTVVRPARAASPGGPQARPSRWQRLQSSPWIWLAPMTVLLLAVFVYPMVEIVRLSFTEAGLIEPVQDYTLGSYADVLGSAGFARTLRVTFLFVVASIVFQILLGLAIALLIDEASRRGLRGTVVTRTAVLTAWAIPGVVIGIIWSLLYQETTSGILNYGLSLIGLSGQVPFLSDPTSALVSVIVANVWRGTAFSMILCYAGLQTVSRDILEAARVDGASYWRTLRSIVLPLLLPILTINVIIVTVETFNTFDMVLALTGGGPGTATEVLALRVYSEIFEQLNLGRGAALGAVLMSINVVMIAVYLRVLARRGAVT